MTDVITDGRTAIPLAIVATVASSVLFFFGTGLHPVWWLTWLAPLPVLLVAPRVGRLAAFGVAVLAWSLGGVNFWNYLRNLLEVPIGVVLLSIVLPGCVFGLAVLIHRGLVRRGAILQAALALPALWVTYEYLMAVLSPHGTFANLGYTQMNCLPVLQFASAAGIWGISFWLFLFPATVAVILSKHGSEAWRYRLGVAVCGSLAIVIVYGLWRMHYPPPASSSVKAVLMSSDLRSNIFPQDDGDTLTLLHKYSEEMTRVAQGITGNGSSEDELVVVLPEKIGVISDRSVPEMDGLFQATAKQAKAWIVVGVDRSTGARRVNEARVYSPQGTLSAVYKKQHLIPGFEDIDQPGSQRILLHQPSGTWGIEICKDMDFPRLSREYGIDGVALHLVPAWDFVVDGWLHSRMAIMRGVEGGFPIVRAAKQGLLTVSDNRGRVLAEASSGGTPFAVLVAKVEVSHVSTLYNRFGDWFAWLNVVVLVAIVASLLIRAPAP